MFPQPIMLFQHTSASLNTKNQTTESPATHKHPFEPTSKGGNESQGNLLGKIGLALGCGATVAVPGAIGVKNIDVSVTQFANGSAPNLPKAIFGGLRYSVRHPLKAMRKPDQLAVYGVYAATYGTKNTTQVVSEHVHVDPEIPVFVATTAVNSAVGMRKDRFIAQMYGKTATPFPFISYGAFVIRDGFTIFSAFVAPKYVSYTLQERFGWRKGVSDTAAQFGCPIVFQVGATPAHLLGLDFYNNPKSALNVRAHRISEQLKGALGARILRQAFVFGGVAQFNTYLTKKAGIGH